MKTQKNVISSRNKFQNLVSLFALSLVLGGCTSNLSEKYSARREQNSEEKSYKSTFMKIDNKLIERIEGFGYSYNAGAWLNNKIIKKQVI